jgi:citrate synthase
MRKESHNARIRLPSLTTAGKWSFPVVIGTEGEKAIDISRLRADTGFITLDPGYANTGSCLSAITYMDGEKGILRYRGIPVEQLAEHPPSKRPPTC